MKRILGLDLGTNSIGWSLINYNFETKEGEIKALGSRIIPMSQDILSDFGKGNSHSQTAERTSYRGIRRLYQRDNLRRERLHRVLNIMGFLPKHYAESIDFEKKLGQFKPNIEEKLNYSKNQKGRFEFIFTDSFNEMIDEFKVNQPQLFYKKENGKTTKIPYDWTLYYLRQKALSKKITKEELAWLILNFNQKRGYYQLRGEETDNDSSKNEEYYNLKVKEVIPTEDKNAKGIWYNVVLENNWIYRRQSKDSLDSWTGKFKEFIVTTQLDKDGTYKLDKDGNIKRSFRSVDSTKDWIAIKSKTEDDIAKSKKTVGQFIYENLLKNPTQKIRGELVKTIERKFYKEEFQKILSKQIELQPELFSNELYIECVKELYPRNESHQNSLKDKGFKHLILEDIIFYQRPLKSQKSNISGCQFENRSYKKKNKETGKSEIVTQSINGISKSHPLFQEFRIWQWLQNLRIYNSEKIINGKLEDITPSLLDSEEDWCLLFDFLNTKQIIEQKHIIAYFVKNNKIEKNQKDNYCWNYVEDKKYPCAETKTQFVNRLKKVTGIKNAEEFLSENTLVGKKETGSLVSRIDQLWHIIYSISDIREYKSALEKFAYKHNINKDSFVENFIKFPPFDSDYSSYSKKAIEKLLPLMRLGRYWSENKISKSTFDRIEKIINAEYDEKIENRVRENAIKLKSISDFKGLPLWLTCYIVYNRHSEVGDLKEWKHSHEITKYLRNFKQHSLRNPIVEQVVTETLRVVKDIWEYHGNIENTPYIEIYDEVSKKNIKSYKSFFDKIHIELGREMKNPAAKRKKISERNIENENTNHRIKKILKELKNNSDIEGDIKSYSPSQQEILKIYEEGVYQNPTVNFNKVSEDEINKIRKNNNPSQKEIQRYKLWLEQGYISPYTGKIIPLSKLFTHEYEIEHIIPQSRYFDNSLNNKIICESDINQDKSNKTALEYLKGREGSVINGHKLFSLEKYEAHVNKYFNKNKQKLKNLLSEDIPEGFINRQLNDSRYISKLIKGLLSNIVREENEKEATSKNIIPVTGAITSKLKHDWGLNDKWNELIAPRFKRLNEMTNTKDFGNWDDKIKAFRIQIPDKISKGFSSKRIDHRHHALDALVIACTTRDHTHYLSALNSEKKNYSLRDKLLVKNKHGDYINAFSLPWKGFTNQAKETLGKTIVSFKQNTRVINKTNNKFWSYKDENGKLNLGKDGKPKKKLRKQTKGKNWAIRKSLHKETVSGFYNIETPKGKIATSVRTSLSDIKNNKQLAKITDQRIREVILPNHLKNYIDLDGKIKYDVAFSHEGIEDLNKNIISLNNNKNHKPIKKVKLFEIGSKFNVGSKGNRTTKFVEAAKGTNLFFSIYWDETKQKRIYETVPLNEVIEHQKQVAHLPRKERASVPVNFNKGQFLFSLSPNDLVYVPLDEELENSTIINWESLTNEQVTRVYKMVSSTGIQCFFILSNVAKSIQNKFEYSSLNKMERTIDGSMIKERCWKLKVDRLGNITDVIK